MAKGHPLNVIADTKKETLENLRLVKAFGKIKSPTVRKEVLALLEKLAGIRR
jgi:hypothetical protein